MNRGSKPGHGPEESHCKLRNASHGGGYNVEATKRFPAVSQVGSPEVFIPSTSKPTDSVG